MPSNSHRLCVSILPESTAHLEVLLGACPDADLIELRLDKLAGVDFARIRQLTGKPLIAAWRSKAEGGYWQGDPARLLPRYREALEHGVDYIDVEFRNAASLLPPLQFAADQIILSSHLTQRREKPPGEHLRAMLQTPAGFYKLIFPAEELDDNLQLFPLIETAREAQKSHIIHGMGAASKISRVLGALQGNAWSYVSHPSQTPLAEGQLSYEEARDVFRLTRARPQTGILGLVGTPLHQSKGQLLHNRLIGKHLQAEEPGYVYLNFEAATFPEFWEEWQTHVQGISITRPFKEAVLPYLDSASTEVRMSGVCNTLVRTSKGWVGHNTDMLAIETLLRPYRDSIREGGVVVGTGATARSAIAALKRLEVDPVFVVGRNEIRGLQLAQKFNIDFLQEDEIHYAAAAVVVQTTPVGQTPDIDQYPVGTSLFRRDRVVLDVVYNPAETRFLKIARDRNCITISGVEMFLQQAARQFELFTGIPISVDEVRECWGNIL